MAAIWKGSLTFGLVNIPVELKTAVRADHISFRLLHKEDLSPVKYERVCQAEGEPVAMVYPNQETIGTLVTPATVCLVRGAPHPTEAQALIEYLVGPKVTAKLAALQFYQLAIPPPIPPAV